MEVFIKVILVYGDYEKKTCSEENKIKSNVSTLCLQELLKVELHALLLSSVFTIVVYGIWVGSEVTILSLVGS